MSTTCTHSHITENNGYMSTLFDIEKIPVASGKSNEWYTPAKYIEAARAVMQGIDLDPASCELANRTVKATTYYTKELLNWLQEQRSNIEALQE